MSTNPPLPRTGQYRVVRREPGYLVMYSSTGEPATVGTRGYERELQETVDEIQQGDGLKLSARGIHDARTVGRFQSVTIVDRRAIRLISRPTSVPKPFSELWDNRSEETATSGFANKAGQRIADVVLKPVTTALLTQLWNGLFDFESQFKNRTFGSRHPTDILVVNNERTDYVTIIYHTELTAALEKLYQRYFSEYDAGIDTGDQFKAELLYPEYRQFRPDVSEDVPAHAVLTAEQNPYPRTSRVSGPVLDHCQPSTKRDEPRRSSPDPESSPDRDSASADTPSASNAEATSDTDPADATDQSSQSTEPELSSVEDLDIELEHPWVETAAVTMADYGGRPELCQTIENTVIVPFRDHLEQAKQLGVPVPSLLLYGPPGTGKTYLAEALAGEIGYPYVTLSGGDMLSRYVNASTENVNDLFAEARAIAEQAGGALIFIDEIDSVLKNRQASNQHAEDRKVVNEFLTQIEKVGGENILFIGATNVYDELDSAALSRFDMELFVDLPDEQTRRDIITAQLTNRAHSVTDSQIEEMAATTEGYSARDLTKIITDAARRTLVQPDNDEITYEECQDSITEFSG